MPKKTTVTLMVSAAVAIGSVAFLARPLDRTMEGSPPRLRSPRGHSRQTAALADRHQDLALACSLLLRYSSSATPMPTETSRPRRPPWPLKSLFVRQIPRNEGQSRPPHWAGRSTAGWVHRRDSVLAAHRMALAVHPMVLVVLPAVPAVPVDLAPACFWGPGYWKRPIPTRMAASRRRKLPGRPSDLSTRPIPRSGARSTKKRWQEPSISAWGRLLALVPVGRAGRWVRSVSWSSSLTGMPTAGSTWWSARPLASR